MNEVFRAGGSMNGVFPPMVSSLRIIGDWLSPSVRPGGAIDFGFTGLLWRFLNGAGAVAEIAILKPRSLLSLTGQHY
jgi:hypothetical protein